MQIRFASFDRKKHGALNKIALKKWCTRLDRLCMNLHYLSFQVEEGVVS
jgi:hypothetical protein